MHENFTHFTTTAVRKHNFYYTLPFPHALPDTYEAALNDRIYQEAKTIAARLKVEDPIQYDREKLEQEQHSQPLSLHQEDQCMPMLYPWSSVRRVARVRRWTRVMTRALPLREMAPTSRNENVEFYIKHQRHLHHCAWHNALLEERLQMYIWLENIAAQQLELPIPFPQVYQEFSAHQVGGLYLDSKPPPVTKSMIALFKRSLGFNNRDWMNAPGTIDKSQHPYIFTKFNPTSQRDRKGRKQHIFANLWHLPEVDIVDTDKAILNTLERFNIAANFTHTSSPYFKGQHIWAAAIIHVIARAFMFMPRHFVVPKVVLEWELLLRNFCNSKRHSLSSHLPVSEVHLQDLINMYYTYCDQLLNRPDDEFSKEDHGTALRFMLWPCYANRLRNTKHKAIISYANMTAMYHSALEAQLYDFEATHHPNNCTRYHDILDELQFLRQKRYHDDWYQVRNEIATWHASESNFNIEEDDDNTVLNNYTTDYSLEDEEDIQFNLVLN